VLHGRERPSTILLDDFDHALHPRAQMELVRMIKELLDLDEYSDTQIIAATHSPYVLDEIAPSNVIAFAFARTARSPPGRYPSTPMRPRSTGP
jgi:predicted ATPase